MPDTDDKRWTYRRHGLLWEEWCPPIGDRPGYPDGSTIETAGACDHCEDTTPRLMIELQERVPYEQPGVTVCRDCLAAMLAALDRAPELLAAPDAENETP